MTVAATTEAQDFENLILFSYRFGALVEHSALFADANLSVAAFSVLAAAEHESGKSFARIAARASVFDRAQRKALMGLLLKEELLASTADEGGKRQFALTPAGHALLADMRSKFASAVDVAKVKSWKAVPRFASIARSLRPVLVAPEQPAA